MENKKELEVVDNRSLSVKEIKTQVATIQQVMKEVMKENTHYGVIPGCGDKPTLLKAGAEKLMMLFRLGAEHVVEDLSVGDEMRYRIITKIYHTPTNTFLGTGVGEASTNEKKYKWRNAICEEEYNETPENMRQILYKKFGNRIEKVKQVRANPADIANTVLKMAKKRSLVDAVLSVTAASDIFTQDIEEMVIDTPIAEAKEAEKSEKAEPPKRKSETQKPQEQDDVQSVSGVIEDVQVKMGKNKNGNWLRYGIIINGVTYGTFNDDIGKIANERIGEEVTINFKDDGKYKNIIALLPNSDGNHNDENYGEDKFSKDWDAIE